MRRALLRAGAGVAAVRLAGMGAGFAVTLALARLLGPEGVGGYAYAVLLLALAAVPLNAGWATVLLRTTACARSGSAAWGEVSGLLRWGLGLALALTMLLALGPGLLVIGPWGQGLLGFGAVALLAGTLFFDQMSGLRLAVLRGLDHPVWGQVPEMLLRPLLILGIFLALATLGDAPVGLHDAFVALAAAAVLTAVAGGVILWNKAPGALRQARPAGAPRDWMRGATLLAGNAGLVMLNAQVDFLMLGLLGTPEDLGHYRVAMQIGLLGGFGYTALNMIALQRFADLVPRGGHEDLQRSATFMARAALLAALPLPVVFWLWGEPILVALAGPGFEAALAPTLWLLALQVVNAATGFAHSALVMAGREGRILPLTALSTLVTAGLGAVLIPRLGPEGAAIAAFVSLALWNVALLVMSLGLVRVDTSALGCLPRRRP